MIVDAQNNSSGNDTEYVSSYEETAYVLWKVAAPILLVFGTFGNVLSIIVLNRNSMTTSRVSLYFIALAVTDIFVLWNGLLRQWILYTFDLDIREVHSVVCKLNTWFVYFSLALSAWILASLTIERAISVSRPLKVRSMYTKRTITLNLSVVTFVLMAVNGHFLFGRGQELDDDQMKQCVHHSQGYQHFVGHVFPWIDLCMYCLLPFLVQIIGNCVIIFHMIKSTRTITRFRISSRQQTISRRQQVSSMTRMTLCLNLMYLVCTLPVSVYFIYTTRWEQDESPEAQGLRTLVYSCLSILMYVNNATNFMAYILSGQRFRAELRVLLCCQNVPRLSTFVISYSRSKDPSQVVESSGGQVSLTSHQQH